MLDQFELYKIGQWNLPQMREENMKLSELKTIFYTQGLEDAATGRHIEALSQEFWTQWTEYAHRKITKGFGFAELVKCFPHYRKGILDARKA